MVNNDINKRTESRIVFACNFGSSYVIVKHKSTCWLQWDRWYIKNACMQNTNFLNIENFQIINKCTFPAIKAGCFFG